MPGRSSAAVPAQGQPPTPRVAQWFAQPRPLRHRQWPGRAPGDLLRDTAWPVGSPWGALEAAEASPTSEPHSTAAPARDGPPLDAPAPGEETPPSGGPVCTCHGPTPPHPPEREREREREETVQSCRALSAREVPVAGTCRSALRARWPCLSGHPILFPLVPPGFRGRGCPAAPWPYALERDVATRAGVGPQNPKGPRTKVPLVEVLGLPRWLG